MSLEDDTLDHVSPEAGDIQDKLRQGRYEGLVTMLRHAVREVDQEVARSLGKITACAVLQVCDSSEQLRRDAGRYLRQLRYSGKELFRVLTDNLDVEGIEVICRPILTSFGQTV